MRFYTKQHPFYCGIDLHARTMSLCVLNQAGDILVHRHMPAGPAPFLTAIAPYREDLVVCVEGLFTWYWRVDLCAREGLPFVLGHALSMKAIHGGKAKNATSDAQKIVGLFRGGMLPQAYVYPADMRATRDLLRRRIPLMRQRADLLAHIHNTHSQYNLPEMGKTIVYQANRAGVAKRFPAPAVQQSVAVDLALIDPYAWLLRAVELSILHTAKQPNANTLSLLRTAPGSGELLSSVLLYEIHDMQRFSRVQDCVSSCRLVKCAKESAGKRYGTSGAQLGNASLTFGPFPQRRGCSSAPIPPARSLWPAWRNNMGKALTVLAQKLARAVYPM